MANLNKVLLIGRLTRDPELRVTPSGASIADFGLAVNRFYTGKDSNRQEETAFVDISAWGKTAELANQYLKKGRQVFVEGRLKFDQWTGKDGQKRSKLTVVAENLQFLDGGRDGDSSQGNTGGEQSGGYSRGRPAPSPSDDMPPFGNDDSDIPF